MIDEKLVVKLKEIFEKYKEIEKVILFGSRARGDNKYNSDIDICIVGAGMMHLTLANINMDISEINTPLSFDILSFNELNKEELIKNILKEGVVIYNGKEIR
ncbi:nucleotidyltransferase domain-containing protein [Clostridium sp. CM028]|uniref:nucleotidyltransferase domain-containing protein n=3 Tax=Clostridium TaxID=1485 RepID=UPI001C6F509E|nr:MULTISPECIES: nucleotidyltransferase domain-containing protein [unclassified Clostridium]MBW9146556.1 nucleotidyltransferase domain-containing protein [Clostridium sp. CM027]MBW9150484.1 nucleotidyltransferase domain-containing protein [Clostridium sp. CM028]UVE42242.1 nucleotidyltransferase domain-containing protein [Clostridium sp. CM027]WLC62829.1 nucleotidyltransferase domain-containing protein [Clostridium sp. CM028]